MSIADGCDSGSRVRVPGPGSCAQTEERLAAIVRLLESRDDHLEVLAARATHALPGAGVTDAYLVKSPKPYGLDGQVHECARDRDGEIDRLAAQTRPAFGSVADEIGEANRRGERWERVRAAKWARFDYAALDRALEELRAHDQGGYRVVHAVYVYGWLEPSVVVEAACRRALEFLSVWLPERLRAPEVAVDRGASLAARGRWADAVARGRRDELLRRWVRVEGMPVQWVAWVCGLSVSQVNRIVRKQAA
jgi:hypothetical protein